jgi:hypothetical protein
MSTPPNEDPVSGVVAFTARGDAALDELAATMAAQCDGSPESIADLLQQVLEPDIERLAEALSAAVTDARSPEVLASHDDLDIAPPVESPDDAARRRLGTRARLSNADAPDTRPINR